MFPIYLDSINSDRDNNHSMVVWSEPKFALVKVESMSPYYTHYINTTELSRDIANFCYCFEQILDCFLSLFHQYLNTIRTPFENYLSIIPVIFCGLPEYDTCNFPRATFQIKDYGHRILQKSTENSRKWKQYSNRKFIEFFLVNSS